uniref:Putative ovule protein n=1 Tax=Solanum chacoense TaxID=4108 RepID=A0A0V0HAL7_SOLCH
MRNSFFPLLSTFIVSQTIFISITLLFALILVFVVRILQSLGLIELKSDLDHVLFLVIFSLIVLAPILIWLQVNWSLAYVITVVESKKGYETLRRSAKLVKGERWVALKILMYYEPVIVWMVVWCSMFLARGEQWRSFTGILLYAFTSVMGYILMNQYLVANVVLYMHCKELNDEKLMSETAAGEYVSLSVEEEERNHDVV